MHPFGLTSFGPGPPRARGQPTAVDGLLRSGANDAAAFAIGWHRDLAMQTFASNLRFVVLLAT